MARAAAAKKWPRRSHCRGWSNAEVRLVDEGSRLQRLIRFPLAGEPRPGELPQFVIHFRQQLASRPWSVRTIRGGCHRPAIMTPERIGRLKSNFRDVSAHRAHWRPASTTSCSRLRRASTAVSRGLDLASGTFRGRAGAGDQKPGRHGRAAGLAQGSRRTHVRWGATPEDYFIVRDALVRAIRGASVVDRGARSRLAPRHHRDRGADASRRRRAHRCRRRAARGQRPTEPELARPPTRPNPSPRVACAGMPPAR